MNKLIRRMVGVAGATALAAVSFIAPAHAAGPDPYTTPGGHIVNQRLWNTTCEMYSKSVVRCRTDIWATMVQLKDGTFRNVTGWHFNNLTYLPSMRAQWAKNPLGKTGSFTKDGRKWKTECDTSATGKGGCRSYIWTDYAAYEGGTYVKKSDYVFNNMVRFAEGSIKPVTAIPTHVLDRSQLTVYGLGPLSSTGNDAVDMANWAKLGYVVELTDSCYAYDNSHLLDQRGIDVINGVFDVAVSKPGIKTPSGAEAGMTIKQIKAIYGSKFKVLRKDNYGAKQYFGSVRVGDRELQFRVQGAPDGHGDFEYAPTRPLVDTDKVVEIASQRFLMDVSFDGC